MPPTIEWDVVGERTYETGADHGVLYERNSTTGAYDAGAVPWNGLTTVTESPSGAEANPQYADNIKYLNLISAEDFAATIEAFTSPKEFDKYDGSAELAPGVNIGQQKRGTFGFSYRTKVGNDLVGQDYGYKLHLIYGAQAAPTERAYATVNDSPEAQQLSWELSTTPVNVEGFSPTASLTVNSTTSDAAALAELETILYGDGTTPGRLPLPDEVNELFAGTSGTQTARVFSAQTFDDGSVDLTGNEINENPDGSVDVTDDDQDQSSTVETNPDGSVDVTTTN